jgi:cytochrome P450
MEVCGAYLALLFMRYPWSASQLLCTNHMIKAQALITQLLACELPARHYPLHAQQRSLQAKCGGSRIIRSPRFFSTAISILDVEGIKIAMTSRHNGRRVLSTQPLATMQRLFGRTSLLNVGGAAHTRLKKLMHPTIGVS